MGERERELGPDDPLHAGASGWESLELDRNAGAPAAPAGSDLLYGEASGRVIGDAFDGLGGGSEVELELDVGAMRSGAPTDLPAPSLSPAAPRAAHAPVERSLPPPASRSLAPRSLGPPEPIGASSAVPPRAIVLADYGPPPTGIVATVPYSVHVVLRQRALRQQLGAARLTLARSKTDLTEALIELGRQLHAHRDHPDLEPFVALLRAAEAAGQVTSEHAAEWQRVEGEMAARASAIDERRRAIEDESAPAAERERALAQEHAERDRALKRAEAMLSRTKIELRNLGASAGDPARSQALSAERAHREREVAEARARVAELEPTVRAAREALADRDRKLAELDRERRGIAKTQDRSRSVLSESAMAAEDEYHAAVIQLAEQALSRGAAMALAPQLAKLARTRTETVQTHEREIELLTIALTLHDRRAVQRGLTILGVLAALALGTLAFAMLR
ncbi:MAG: hypothetical protein AB7S26_08760 [Sandaracinaceae bacterium]